MTPARLLLPLLVAAAAVACRPSEPALAPPPADVVDGAVTVTLLDSVAPPGGVIRIRQVNTIASDVGHNHCDRRVQRWNGSDWVTLPEELRICTAALYPLEAGASQELGVDVPADASPGPHRFVLRFWPMSGQGEALTVRTPPFEVRQP